MISLPPSLKIFVCPNPCDMRRSFDGLAAMVETLIQRDPLSGHLFVFCNRKRDRVKILYWDMDGYAIWYKRLEVGCYDFLTFAKRASADEPLELRADELTMLLGGVDLASVKRRKRYRRRDTDASSDGRRR